MDEVSALVLAVIDEFLRKHGFASGAGVTEEMSPSKLPPRSQVDASTHQPSPLSARLTGTSPRRAQLLHTDLDYTHRTQSASPKKRLLQVPLSPTERKRARRHDGCDDLDNADGCRWLQDLLKVSDGFQLPKLTISGPVHSHLYRALVSGQSVYQSYWRRRILTTM